MNKCCEETQAVLIEECCQAICSNCGDLRYDPPVQVGSLWLHPEKGHSVGWANAPCGAGRIRALKPDTQQALERYVAERTEGVLERARTAEDACGAYRNEIIAVHEREKELSERISCGHRKADLVETEESKAACAFDSTMQPVVVCSACEREKPLVKAAERAATVLHSLPSVEGSLVRTAEMWLEQALAAVRGGEK